MDDCLFSVASAGEATYLIGQVTKHLQNRGFNLTKWLSNDCDVLKSIPTTKLSNSAVSLTCKTDNLQVCERLLGLLWNCSDDNFQFSLQLNKKPSTRRGILSVLSSIFNPLGFLSPITLSAKLLLQDLCRRKLSWDDSVPEEDAAIWMRWLDTLSDIDKVKIPRCFITLSMEFDSLTQRQLHHFGDASQKGNGIVSYLQVVAPDGSIFCSFVLGKARLAPIKTVLISRLELLDATLAVVRGVGCYFGRLNVEWELSDVITVSIFWTDFLAVLFMIKSTTKRYSVFVANTLSKIEEVSDPCQWHFIDGVQNPADDALQGLLNTERLKSCWLQGPPFLLKEESEWPEPQCVLPDLPLEFKVLRRTTVAVTKTSFLPKALSMNRRFARFSSLYRLKKSVAWILWLRSKLLKQ